MLQTAEVLLIPVDMEMLEGGGPDIGEQIAEGALEYLLSLGRSHDKPAVIVYPEDSALEKAAQKFADELPVNEPPTIIPSQQLTDAVTTFSGVQSIEDWAGPQNSSKLDRSTVYNFVPRPLLETCIGVEGVDPFEWLFTRNAERPPLDPVIIVETLHHEPDAPLPSFGLTLHNERTTHFAHERCGAIKGSSAPIKAPKEKFIPLPPEEAAKWEWLYSRDAQQPQIEIELQEAA